MKGCFTILTIKLYILSNYIVTSLILLFFVIVIIFFIFNGYAKDFNVFRKDLPKICQKETYYKI